MTLRQEKSNTLTDSIGKAGIKDYSTALSGSSWSQVGTAIGNDKSNGYGGTFSAGEGPSLFKANEGDVNGYQYYLFADQPSWSRRSEPLRAHGDHRHFRRFEVDGNRRQDARGELPRQFRWWQAPSRHRGSGHPRPGIRPCLKPMRRASRSSRWHRLTCPLTPGPLRRCISYYFICIDFYRILNFAYFKIFKICGESKRFSSAIS